MKLAYIVFVLCVSAAPCFDFGLAGVLGIAFGGFLIGVLLIGALWFIKIKTGKCKKEKKTQNNSTDLVNKYTSRCVEFNESPFASHQGTRAGWTLAQLQQGSPVRLYFFCCCFVFVSPCILSQVSLPRSFRVPLHRSEAATCFHQPFPLREQQR